MFGYRTISWVTRRIQIIAFAIMSLAPCFASHGYCAATQPSADTNPANDTPPPAVVDVRRLGAPDDDRTIALNDTVVVKIANLDKWGPSTQNSAHIVPYINGIPMKKTYPLAVNVGADTVTFRLAWSPDDKDAWIALFDNAPLFTHQFRNIPFTIGTEEGNVVQPFTESSWTDEKSKNPTPLPVLTNVTLTILPGWFWVFPLLLIVALALFIWLSRVSYVLRDTDDCPPAGKSPPYSLARFQLAFWFFIVVASFCAIWMITGNLDVLSPSVLGLLGISSATTAASLLLDSSKASQRAAKGVEIQQAKDTLEAINQKLKNSAGPNLNLVAEQTKAQNDLDQRQKELDAMYAGFQASEGFWIDILSDSEGVNIQRFQAVIWTIVLGLIFVITVCRTVEMPDFSATLLGLMGISSGTYVLLKIPEKS